jgi:ribonuclease Z
MKSRRFGLNVCDWITVFRVLAFALVEATHVNVRKDALARLGLKPGPWLNELKNALRQSSPPDTTFTAPTADPSDPREFRASLRELERELIVETPGQRIVYIVDTLFQPAKCRARRRDGAWRRRIVLRVSIPGRGPWEALKRFHLTARQAGTIARMANVKQLRTFHFSPRYDGRGDELLAEAEATFHGRIAPDEPV